MARSGGTLVSSANCTSIIVSANPNENAFVEGIIGASITPKPGTIVQEDHSIALVGGRRTWKLYDADADGGRPKGPFILLLEDRMQGKTPNDAYAAGDRAFGIIPYAGLEFNGLYNNVSGTADDVAIGDIAIVDDTTGKFMVTTGSPETEVAQFDEAYTDPTADKLLWMTWTGY